MMTKTIIFDYDGTIHHTLGIYEPAFRETYQWLTEQKVTAVSYTHLENDVIGKYVEKLLGIRKNEEEKKESGITMEFLEEFGF